MFTEDRDEVARAEGLLQARKYREAEIVLTRQAQKWRNDFGIQLRLLAAHKGMAEENLSNRDYKATGEEWDAADGALIMMKTIVLNPDVTLPENYEVLVKREEDDVVAGRKRLMDAADEQCASWLTEAEKFRQEAARIVLKNNRDKVVAGLRLVRKCEEFSAWSSVDTRGNSINAMRRLIGLVTPEERPAILGAAGFDQNTVRP